MEDARRLASRVGNTCLAPVPLTL